MTTARDRASVPLATPQALRDRLGPEAAGLPDALLEELIAEQQAVVEAVARRAFGPGDPGFALARSATTNLAAAAALLRLRGEVAAGADVRLGKLGVSRRSQLLAWDRLAGHLRFTGEEALGILERDARARRVTLIHGGDL